MPNFNSAHFQVRMPALIPKFIYIAILSMSVMVNAWGQASVQIFTSAALLYSGNSKALWKSGGVLPDYFNAALAEAAVDRQSKQILSSASDFYRSKNTLGNWGVPGDWESSPDSINWETASLVPDEQSGGIFIQTGHTMSISSGSFTADQVAVATGGTIILDGGSLTLNDGVGTDLLVSGTFTSAAGTLTANSGSITQFASGAVYNHDRSDGAIPAANWDTASTCTVTGITNSVIGGMGQNFGNFTWNCPLQSINYIINEAGFGTKGTFTVSKTGDSNARINGFVIYLSLWNGGPAGSTGDFTFGSIVTNGTGVLAFNDQTDNLRNDIPSYTSYVRISGNLSVTENSALVPSLGRASTVTGSTFKSVAFLGGDLLLTSAATLFVSSFRYSIFLFNKAGTQKINYHPSVLNYPMHQRLSYAVTPGSTVQLDSDLRLFSFNRTQDRADFSVSGTLDCRNYVLGDESLKENCTQPPCTTPGESSNFYLAGNTALMPLNERTALANTQAQSDVLTGMDSIRTSILVAGMLVSGEGIPAETYILGRSADGTKVFLSRYATASGSNILLTFNSNGKIITGNPDGLNSAGLTGSIQTAGQRRFASTADYTFNGSTQNTGSFVTSPDTSFIHSLTIAASDTVHNTFGSPLRITGDLIVHSGTFNAGSDSIILTGPDSLASPPNPSVISTSSLMIDGGSNDIHNTSGVSALNLQYNSFGLVSVNRPPNLGAKALTTNSPVSGGGFFKFNLSVLPNFNNAPVRSTKLQLQKK